MKGTFKNPERIPRKIKKLIIKKFGRKLYGDIMNYNQTHTLLKPYIITHFLHNKYKNIYMGHSIFIECE